MADQAGNMESRVASLEARVARLEASGPTTAATHVVYHYGMPPCTSMPPCTAMPPCACGFASDAADLNETAAPKPADFAKLGE